MALTLKSRLGKVEVLASNPRSIRDNQFNALVESIRRDPEFLMARGVVVWKVPQDLGPDEGRKSPFRGQKGRLVVLGGNMRCMAFRALGFKELKDEWIVEAKDENGNWWEPEKAERFVLVDNSQPGNSGDNDYQKLLEGFEESILRDSGIDFSEFEVLMGQTPAIPSADAGDEDEDDDATVEDEVEQGPHGENSEELADFISEREKTRRNLKEIDEFGFYLVLVFESLAQKIEFVQKAGLTGKKGVTTVDSGTSVVAVFETFDQKMDFCEKMGLNTDLNDPQGDILFGMFCDGRDFAKKMGIELAESGLKFRDRILDHQLEEMALPPQQQKSAKEIEEEVYANLKAERAELGMPTGRGGVSSKSGKKGKGKKKSDEPSYEDVADGDVVPSWMEEEPETDGVFVAPDEDDVSGIPEDS